MRLWAGKKIATAIKCVSVCVCVSGGHMNMEIFWHDCLADAGELQNAQALELIAEHMAYA